MSVVLILYMHEKTSSASRIDRSPEIAAVPCRFFLLLEVTPKY